MKNKDCPHCEAKGTVSEQEISIPVGKETFKTNTYRCKKCDHYALTPKIRKEMDAWGNALGKNVVEPQPIFTQVQHEYADRLAAQFGITRGPFMKALVVYYLNHLVNQPNYSEIRALCEKHKSKDLMKDGEKSKISVPIKYQLYKKLQTYSEVWDVPVAKAIEEAVIVGLTIFSTNNENYKILQDVAADLKRYIVDYAMAA